MFVDEIHAEPQVEEVLYPAMEDYAIDIMIGKGASARSIRLDLPKFTLVGATTRAGMLTAPLRDRFGVVTRMEYYTVEELKTIILRSARVLEVGIDEKGAEALAKRSRGTPRLANRLLKRVRDFAQVKYDGYITREVADYALDLLDVDKEGLDQTDRDLLILMIEKFGGGPVGLDTLAAALGEDAGTIEDVLEPLSSEEWIYPEDAKRPYCYGPGMGTSGVYPEKKKNSWFYTGLVYNRYQDYESSRRLLMASSKNYTEVLIGGKVFTLSGFESEEYLQKVSTYLNHKIEECSSSDGYRKQSSETRSILLALNIADDYFKAKKQGGTLESDIETKDKEMYDLKHELISVQIKLENAEKAMDKLKEENKELQMKIVQLETEIKNNRKK